MSKNGRGIAWRCGGFNRAIRWFSVTPSVPGGWKKTREIKFLRIWSDDAEGKAAENTERQRISVLQLVDTSTGFGIKDGHRDEEDWHGNVIKNALSTPTASHCFEFSPWNRLFLLTELANYFTDWRRGEKDREKRRVEKGGPRRKDSWQATWKLVITFRPSNDRNRRKGILLRFSPRCFYEII